MPWFLTNAMAIMKSNFEGVLKCLYLFPSLPFGKPH
jgi:hypothetical protein